MYYSYTAHEIKLNSGDMFFYQMTNRAARLFTRRLVDVISIDLSNYKHIYTGN